MSNHPARANDITRAVHLLRQNGMTVGFPMQTAMGEMIFPVGNSSTFYADRRPDTRTIRTGRTGRGRRAQISRVPGIDDSTVEELEKTSLLFLVQQVYEEFYRCPGHDSALVRFARSIRS